MKFSAPPHALLSGALVAALVALPVTAQQPRQSADMIVTADRIYTVDQKRPLVQALAIRDGHIVYAGPVAGARALAGGSTRVLEFPGRTIIPGMVDAHGHLMGLGEALQAVDLVDTKSYDEVIERVVARAKTTPPGTWIQGNGWDQNDWGDTRFPTHEKLSRAVPDHPVVLSRVDGHALLANAKAMQAARVTRSTPDPKGGRIIKLPNGEPSGVFVDNAQDLIYRAVPSMSRDEKKKALTAAVAEANKWGLIGVHDAGEPRSTIDVIEEMAKEGSLNLRAYVMIGDDSAAITHYFERGPQSALYDGHLWIRSIKLYADGALGSRGAALLDPYSDDPGNYGLLVSSPEHLQAIAVEALQHGFQVATHAIGDRGNRIVLDAYEAALEKVPTADHRFRVEHAQIVDHADIPRFAQLGVIPSMQAVHQTSDMYWAEQRLGGGRLYGAYAWRALLETGVVIPDGSDFPVEGVNPLRSFHSAVSREDENNWPPGGWHPEEKMTRREALEGMTIWPAYAAFQEDIMGSLTPGKYADFVVLDRDIMTVPAEDILGTQVVATYIGGKAVYERK
ncbi:MAG TPA: amidohydrolase family protein [Gemmatimonadaceae bacterium]|nr:amidohydrolase family protein [Gemmatimonadaceae bacterium]